MNRSRADGRTARTGQTRVTRAGAGSRPWVRFCLTAHFRQASTLMRRANIMQRLWDSLEHEAARLGLPDRTIVVLGEAALGFKARNATYRKAAEISENLASRDLKGLVDAGLLVPEGEKRGRYYVASNALRNIGNDAAGAESRSIPDPFEFTGDPPGSAQLT